MEDSEHVVRECKAMADEEPRTGWNQVRRQVHKFNQGDMSKPKRGINREELEIRQDFPSTEAFLGRCSYDMKDEGHRVQLEFEAIKRVGLGEEHSWTPLIEGSDDFQWTKC